MKFAHIADTHLGMEQYNKPEREQDMYDAFNQAIDISIKEKVDFVVLSGDIFQVPKPNNRAIVEMANILMELKKNNIPIFFILGDHDISRVNKTPIPYVYHNLGAGTYLVNNKKPIYYKGVMIAGIDCFKEYEMNDEESTIRDDFNELDEKAKDHEGHRILLLHQGLIEFNKFGNFLTIEDIPKHFTYYAMGHLHNHDIKKFETLNGPIVYPGSTETSLTEGIKDKTTKGFCIVDISTDEPVIEWKQLDIRPQLEFSIQYDTIETDVKSIISEIQQYERKPVVKLNIHGKDIDRIKTDSIIKDINEYVLYIKTIYLDMLNSSQIIDIRPGNIHDELLQKTVDILGDEEMANIAIKRLLPALLEGKGLDVLQDIFKERQT